MSHRIPKQAIFHANTLCMTTPKQGTHHNGSKGPAALFASLVSHKSEKTNAAIGQKLSSAQAAVNYRSKKGSKHLDCSRGATLAFCISPCLSTISQECNGSPKLKIFKSLCALILLSACTTELTPEAAKVRRIPASLDGKCEFLGPVKGVEHFGMSVSEDAESALNQVRNAVASIGGNAFTLTSTASTLDGTIFLADAYLCR